MILDYSHGDIVKLNAEEKRRLEQGQCPRCKHEHFSTQKNTMLPFSDDEYIICNECDYTLGSNYFKPHTKTKPYIPAKFRTTASRIVEMETEPEQRRKAFDRLSRLAKTASTESEYKELAVGFQSLSDYPEYKKENADFSALEFEEKYLIKRYEGLKDKISTDATEEHYKNLQCNFKQVATELRSLANKKQQINE